MIDGPPLLDAALDAALDACMGDCDGDGFPAGPDCNDRDPTVNPGAIDICNTIDDDCSGMADEMAATFDPGTGAVDVSATFVTGTMAAPVAYTPPSAGTLRLCGAGPYYAQITTAVDLVVDGRGIGNTIVAGGGVARPFTVTGGKLTITDLHVRDGLAVAAPSCGGFANAGGAVACTSAMLTIERTRISASSAMAGGGLATCGCTTSITDAVITGSQATNGAGILMADGLATITTSEISDNAATGSGGGIAVVNGGAQLTLGNSLVTRNTALLGGGIYSEKSLTCSSTVAGTHGVLANAGGSGVWIALGTFASTGCDFGTTAATNNLPNDVRPSQGAGVDFGDNATFSCTATACN